MRVKPSFINLLASSRFARPRKAQLFGLDREDFFYLDAFVMKSIATEEAACKIEAQMVLLLCVPSIAGNASAKL